MVCEFKPHAGLCTDSPLSVSVSLCLSLSLSKINKSTFSKNVFLGTWVAQSVKRPTSAQVMISQFVGSSPTSGSVLTTQSLEPASVSVSPSLFAPPPLMLCLSHSKIINIKKKFL